MSLLGAASRRSLAQRLMPATAVRAYGTTLPVPKAPAGSEMVFHSKMQTPKYALSNPKWFFIFVACNVGAYAGHYFYLKFLMPTNPPNPPRNPDEERPEKHMHAVDDDE
eukprot:TRINITY_DN286_c1_g2_i1.p2 TRINITY_DN286_c1_g2~~TRINITY_DN286_c1_g2_i1.p2  ORF type:complete len:109 (+),score=24.78 TRINITY_DN286_c1_g2_i1:135-461(+)